ncbi:MAG: ISAs1 family transposase [Spirochaetia bacterium]|jgi:predicted transposase YbfD/YdcC|nr:ISAs1 family transposase [Spirochaetia bacterium]
MKKKKDSGLIDYLKDVPDPRVSRTKEHHLIDILTIGVCCLISGGEGFNDMETFGKAKYEWFSRFLELPNGVPSHDTFNRVFSAIDPKAFIECFIAWTDTLRSQFSKEIIAMDGKALRRAGNKDAPMTYIVSAWATENGLTLGQVKVEDKSNEITAIPELLNLLDLEGCIVTIDAMGCQKKIAKEIIDSDSDYVLALKGNQGIAHKEIQEYFDMIVPEKYMEQSTSSDQIDFLKTVDNDHGRVETRRYWISNDLGWFEDKNKWKGLTSIAMVESVREIGNEYSCERRYFLVSMDCDAELFAKACRGHWGVENPLHWTLDVTFKEDNSRARTGNAAENLAALRRLALNMLKKESSQKKLSVRGKRLRAGWDNDYLGKVLGI